MSMSAADLVADARQRIREVSPTQCHASRDGVVLIDVREPAEFEAGHVVDAVNIPRGVLEFQIDSHLAAGDAADSVLQHRGRPVVVYCRSGGRAALAADTLQTLGFSDVRSIAGGIDAWRAAGLPITA